MMVWVPAPAAAGLKEVATTPFTVYLPPAGLPPLRACAGALAQTSPKAASVAVGAAFTWMSRVAVVPAVPQELIVFTPILTAPAVVAKPMRAVLVAPPETMEALPDKTTHSYRAAPA